MRLTIAELDTMPHHLAAEALTACCGSSAWVDGMLLRRPFGKRSALLRAADEEASAMSRTAWLEAFAHHPRIGERRAAADAPEIARQWSAGEQTDAARADAAVQARLAAGNAEYERRFGFIFIICASGRSATEILAALEMRLRHDTETELGIAAAEQRAITRLRLEKLVPPAQDCGV